MMKHMLYFQKRARCETMDGVRVFVCNLYVVSLHGTLAVMHYEAWVLLYILTQFLLEYAILRPAWTLDEHKP